MAADQNNPRVMYRKVFLLKMLLLLLSIGSLLIISSCKDDDGKMAGPQPTGDQMEYSLASVNGSGVSGTALFEKLDDASVRVTLSLMGAMDGEDHPAHIHINTAAEAGTIAIDLENVDGSKGESISVLTQTNAGSPISYEDLIEFDGYINVHKSSSELSILLAQGDIGQNKLTGESVEYELSEVNDSGVSGKATFYKRINNETLIVIALTGDALESDHPAHIHTGSVSSPGSIKIDLINVKAGSSKTNVSAFNDGTPVTFSELLEYAGYINVHHASNDLGTVVSRGNIGSSGEGVTTAINYNVSTSGMSAYVYSGNGLTNSQNPNISLKRGSTYTFTMSASGHPFWIKSVQGSGSSNTFTNGVSGNGSETGVITFVVPMDAPNTLYYNCEYHGAMTGQFNITN